MKHKEPNKKTVNLLLGLLVIGVAMFLFGLSKIGVDIISLIVSLTSFALAILALYLSKRSDDKMKAMARSAFREKMAMMYFYMEREQERRESDVEAVKELEEWVGDD